MKKPLRNSVGERLLEKRTKEKQYEVFHSTVYSTGRFSHEGNYTWEDAISNGENFEEFEVFLATPAFA